MAYEGREGEGRALKKDIHLARHTPHVHSGSKHHSDLPSDSIINRVPHFFSHASLPLHTVPGKSANLSSGISTVAIIYNLPVLTLPSASSSCCILGAGLTSGRHNASAPFTVVLVPVSAQASPSLPGEHLPARRLVHVGQGTQAEGKRRVVLALERHHASALLTVVFVLVSAQAPLSLHGWYTPAKEHEGTEHGASFFALDALSTSSWSSSPCCIPGGLLVRRAMISSSLHREHLPAQRPVHSSERIRADETRPSFLALERLLRSRSVLVLVSVQASPSLPWELLPVWMVHGEGTRRVAAVSSSNAISGTGRMSALAHEHLPLTTRGARRDGPCCARGGGSGTHPERARARKAKRKRTETKRKGSPAQAQMLGQPQRRCPCKTQLVAVFVGEHRGRSAGSRAGAKTICVLLPSRSSTAYVWSWSPRRRRRWRQSAKQICRNPRKHPFIHPEDLLLAGGCALAAVDEFVDVDDVRAGGHLCDAGEERERRADRDEGEAWSERDEVGVSVDLRRGAA
ncbi:hypothetical protein B0H12DRAFT_1235800 [Mycena haematopus]|nr:hypothetical protein B0H12DRAFT_1235800 [Mycena haematopus]